MLKPYEKEVKLFREIPIEPHLLTCNTEKIIKDKVWQIMKSVCSGEYGFVIRLNQIDEIGMGTVDTSTGSVVFPVRFTVTAFKPDINDIVICCVTSVTKTGFFCQIGPLEIFVPHTQIPESYEFKFTNPDDTSDNSSGTFVSKYNTVSKGVYVRVKICAIQKLDIQQIMETLSITNRVKTPYIGGVLEAIGELVDE